MTDTANEEMLQPTVKRQFAVGDKVRFNRAFHVPEMLVIAVFEDAASCFWYDKTWRPCFADFRFEYLDKV